MIETRHPEYTKQLEYWEKYRLTYNGGYDFIDEYLKKYSTRETNADFALRKEISYCPAHAKSAIIDIKNAIYSRMVDIVRSNGPDTFKLARDGQGGGIDLHGRTIDGYIGCVLLPELLSISKVGVWVDKPQTAKNASKADAKNKSPYLYHYVAEDILNWAYDDNNKLIAVLLRDHTLDVDEETKLPKDEVERFRYARLEENGTVTVKIIDRGGVEIQTYSLNIPRIPFVIFEISQSLLTDVADYQIALLNVESSDLHYILKANFPFYTEMYNAAADGYGMIPRVPDGTATATDAKDDAKAKTINVGIGVGRRYPQGTERPAFIHPSSEPLLASMQKQQNMVNDIRKLINVNISNLEPRRASAESKAQDNKTKEEGLSYIGLELETGEREIVDIWCLYEGHENDYKVAYPTNYSTRTDDDRIEEASKLNKLMVVIPSQTYKKEVAKQIAATVLGNKVQVQLRDNINKEIEAAPAIVSDPEVIQKDHEAGFVSTKTASLLRGYPEAEVEQAKKDHAERAARVALAQSEAGARGVADLSTDPAKDAKDEKKQVAEEQVNG